MPTTINRKAEITFPSDLEIRVQRKFDAPRELLFDCATKPEHLTRWWGPRNQELVSCEVDLRVGGGYRFVLRGPDGQEVGFRGEYLELVRPMRLKQTFVYEPFPDHGAIETTTFEEVDGGTLFTTTILHKSKFGRDGMFNAGMEGGMNESHARLDELLASLQ
ncbi:MAG: SRPBCC family protein [Flavobacteriales bacterium]